MIIEKLGHLFIPLSLLDHPILDFLLYQVNLELLDYHLVLAVLNHLLYLELQVVPEVLAFLANQSLRAILLDQVFLDCLLNRVNLDVQHHLLDLVRHLGRNDLGFHGLPFPLLARAVLAVLHFLSTPCLLSFPESQLYHLYRALRVAH